MKLFIVVMAATTILLVRCKNEIKANTQAQNKPASKTKIKIKTKKQEVTYPLQIKPLGFDRNVSYLPKKKDNC